MDIELIYREIISVLRGGFGGAIIGTLITTSVIASIHYCFGKRKEGHKQALERRIQAYAVFINVNSKFMNLKNKLANLSIETKEIVIKHSRLTEKILEKSTSKLPADLVASKRLNKEVKALKEEVKALKEKREALKKVYEEASELFIQSRLTVLLVGSVKVVNELYKSLETNIETEKVSTSGSFPKIVIMMRADVSDEGDLPLYVINNIMFKVNQIFREE